MYTRVPGLGLIPAWQFDMTAANPKINSSVVYPAGMTQETVQSGSPLADFTCLGCTRPSLMGPFDSWGFTNRKLLVGGGLIAGAAALLFALTKVLR